MIDTYAATLALLTASVILQALATVLALRIISLTSQWLPLAVLATGLGMMAARRAFPLWHVLAGGTVPVDIAGEGLALAISAAMLAAVITMRPMFHRLHRTEVELGASARRYRQLFETQRGMNLLVDRDRGLVVEVNQATVDFYGISREGFRERTFASLSCTSENGSRDQLEALAQDGGVFTDRHRDGQGRLRDVEVRAGRAVVDDEGHSLIHVSVADVTERNTAEHLLVSANQDLRRWVAELERHRHDSEIHIELNALLQSCESSLDVGHVVQRLAPALFPDGSGALHLEDAQSGLLACTTRWGTEAPPDATLAREDCWALRRGQLHATEEPRTGLVCPHLAEAAENYTLCVPVRSHGGTPGLLTLSGSPRLREPGGQRQARLLADTVGVAVANLRLRETLRDQSIRDVLTGLFNRRYFEETLSRELARADRDGDPLSLLMADLDFFKAVNDTFGHAAGDRALQSIADLLRRHVRAGDVVCRYGGEEFAVVLPGAAPEQALERASVLRRAAHSVELPGPGPMHGVLSLSVGVASFPAHARRAADLVRSADEALYAAKAAGRDCVSLPPAVPVQVASAAHV